MNTYFLRMNVFYPTLCSKKLKFNNSVSVKSPWINPQKMHLLKKNAYEEEWQTNFINGFFISWPILESGFNMYIEPYIANIAPSFPTSIICLTILFRRNPGKPSYQMAANNCWTFGWATNCGKNEKILGQKIGRRSLERVISF